jgi:HAD superfamily hydrolase (TIGR01490 family)
LKPKVRAALFDMDRTLIRKETATLFVRYQRDRGEATWRDMLRALYWVGQYTLGIVDAPAVAEKALRQFKGTREKALADKCAECFVAYVQEHVCELGRVAVERHRAQGDVVAIVTGATRYGAGPVAKHLGIEHIVASDLEVTHDGLLTGRFIPPLCYGHGKIERTQRLADALGFTLAEATFYSDSLTDLPLLERVREPVCVNPDPRLLRVANKRGWRVERW